MAAGLFIAYVKATHPFGYDPRGGAPTGQQRMQHLLCVHVFERDEADPPYITNEENAHMFGLHFIAGGTEAAFYAKVPQGLPVSPKSLRLRPQVAWNGTLNDVIPRVVH